MEVEVKYIHIFICANMMIVRLFQFFFVDQKLTVNVGEDDKTNHAAS